MMNRQRKLQRSGGLSPDDVNLSNYLDLESQVNAGRLYGGAGHGLNFKLPIGQRVVIKERALPGVRNTFISKRSLMGFDSLDPAASGQIIDRKHLTTGPSGRHLTPFYRVNNDRYRLWYRGTDLAPREADPRDEAPRPGSPSGPAASDLPAPRSPRITRAGAAKGGGTSARKRVRVENEPVDEIQDIGTSKRARLPSASRASPARNRSASQGSPRRDAARPSPMKTRSKKTPEAPKTSSRLPGAYVRLQKLNLPKR